MIRQGRKPLNVKAVGLVALYVALAAFSIVWYEALAGMDCGAKAFQPGSVRTGSDDAQGCTEQLQFHWIKFYGINGLIYGASTLVIFAGSRRKNET